MLCRNFSSRRYKYASFCRLKSTTTILSRNLSFQQRKVRMIILSDTHGDDLKDVSLPSADVALHCGDLTNDSRPAELKRTLAMLRAINAPLKLVIPWNHDFSLEPGYWRRQQRQDGSSAPTQTSKAEDDTDSKALWELLRHAQYDRIFLLPQGTHTFILPPDTEGAGRGGARLRLFASPLTPRCGNWGFQYDRSNPHKWATCIPPATTMQNGDGAVDVVMTHGPPRGIRDGRGMGCAGLLAAIERARPRVHCFGHIHGAWGAEIVAWKRESVPTSTAPIYSNLVDAQRSRVVASLLPATKFTNREGHCCAVDISSDGEHFVERGAQTLFINAAVELRARPPRMPWMVDIDLPVADEDDITAAAETMYQLLL